MERLCRRLVGVVVEAPVCAGDGRTYAGRCAVRVASCMTGVSSLDVVHDGPCDKLSGSGANNDEPSAGSFLTHVHVRYMLSPVRLSSVCPLSVCRL